MTPKRRNKIKAGADSYCSNKCPDCGRPCGQQGSCSLCTKIRDRAKGAASDFWRAKWAAFDFWKDEGENIYEVPEK